MWLNGSTDKKWAELLHYDGNDKVVVLNPGKRKRFTVHEGTIDRESVSQTIEKIIGGDAKFNRISELPQFEVRADL
jgi:hypothetical protein